VPLFKLTIEYNGTRYSGWQIQKNARTVQGEIDRAVQNVTGRNDFELYGSGRTDAGVHAVGQVAHLDVITSLPPGTLLRRLNDELPADINLLAAVVVPHRFHARRDAVGRRYVYQVAMRRAALAKPFVWWVKEPLDIGKMRTAARLFVGMRDFKAFAARDDQTGKRRRTSTGARPAPGGSRAPRGVALQSTPSDLSTLVLIELLEIATEGSLVLIAIEGSHFLWKMVRRIVGVLVAIGRGDLDEAAAAQLLADDPETAARFTAPASGLFLQRVYYGQEPRIVDVTSITPLPGVPR
jgi:tRNA pseudouridine38-40 synthase